MYSIKKCQLKSFAKLAFFASVTNHNLVSTIRTTYNADSVKLGKKIFSMSLLART